VIRVLRSAFISEISGEIAFVFALGVAFSAVTCGLLPMTYP
jgi:hypothetical protein